LRPQFVTISSLEVKQPNAPNLQFFGEQNMYRSFPDFKVGGYEIREEKIVPAVTEYATEECLVAN
jgi:hypothetical protein